MLRGLRSVWANAEVGNEGDKEEGGRGVASGRGIGSGSASHGGDCKGSMMRVSLCSPKGLPLSREFLPARLVLKLVTNPNASGLPSRITF